jgi:hypothetical protein
MPGPKKEMLFQVVRPDAEVETFRIGPHTPAMKTEDVHLVHKLWLDATRIKGLEKVHHSDLVTMALTRFARDYTGDGRQDILKDLRKLEDRRADGGKKATKERVIKEPPEPPVTSG